MGLMIPLLLGLSYLGSICRESEEVLVSKLENWLHRNCQFTRPAWAELEWRAPAAKKGGWIDFGLSGASTCVVTQG